MIPGDIVKIFQDPVDCKGYQGLATLIKKIDDCGVVEHWVVEYADQPEQQYDAYIKESSEPVKL
jgi:hypothetical protein